MSENNLVGILTWVVGVIVALAVGSGMALKHPELNVRILTVPGIPEIIIIIAGWVVIVGAVLSLILAIFNK